LLFCAPAAALARKPAQAVTWAGCKRSGDVRSAEGRPVGPKRRTSVMIEKSAASFAARLLLDLSHTNFATRTLECGCRPQHRVPSPAPREAVHA
jgi:hypothetical protein